MSPVLRVLDAPSEGCYNAVMPFDGDSIFEDFSADVTVNETVCVRLAPMYSRTSGITPTLYWVYFVSYSK